MTAKSNWISACFQKDVSKRTTEKVVSEKQKLEDWLGKYTPGTASDLVVQKNKQDLINAWLQEAKKYSDLVPILILTGPSGCGKTTALRILAKDQNVDVMEWITPLDIENYERGPGSYMQSQSTKFEEFLLSTGRYVSVFCDVKERKKIILIKDFPNVFLIQPSLLQGILRHYSRMGRNPVVFSIPEQMEGFISIFPKALIEELNIQQISFNKVTNKSVMKVLKKISSLNEDCTLSDDVLNKLVESCNGDIRNAILQLSYECAHYTGDSNIVDVIANKKSKKDKKETKKKFCANVVKESNILEIGGKDAQIPIFQRVGRLLYPKKSSGDVGELKHNPEEIVEQTISQPRRFLHMVHENYLKIFRDMDAVFRAIQYSSDSDAMISEFRDRDLTLPMALSTITRGFMTCSITANRKWMPLTNQENASIRKRMQVLREVVTNANPKYVLTPRDAAMDILPITCPEYFIKRTFRCVDSELCYSSGEEEPSTSNAKRLKTHNVTIGISSFSDYKSKLHERALIDEDKRLDSYEIEDIPSDAESDVNGQEDGWVDEDIDFPENFDF